MTVEWLRARTGNKGEGLNKFVENQGYLKVKTIENIYHTFDSVFIKDTLNVS